MPSLALPFLRELGYVLLQRRGVDRFSLLTEAPAWFAQIWGSPASHEKEWCLGEKSPFLETFLYEAEIFWAVPQHGECKSGLWIEKTRAGGEVPLVATALHLESKPVLALLSPGTQYAEQVRILQTARTSLLEHEKLLREIQKKEILLHCIIHDLSQPLSVMSVALDSLQRENIGEQASQFVQLGRRASQQQESMIREVLSAFSADLRSTIQAEKSLNTSPDLLKVATEVVVSQSPPFDAKNVQLTLSKPLGSASFCVNGEETRLRRIFTNLLENALRYSPPGTGVLIKIEDEDKFLKVSVQDDGPGLPPDLPSAQVFALFSKGKEGGGKAGLGLYFCRITVERWGGTIGCESLPEKGARFWFRLPRALAAESSSTPPQPTPSETSRSHKAPRPRAGLHILFADDQEDIRTVTAFRLKQSGHTVSLASNGEAALRISRQERFDVILLDEEMPLMSGVDVVRAVRKDLENERKLPIFVAITGNNTPEDVTRLLAAGFDSVIGKPFRLESLEQRLQEFARSPQGSAAKPAASLAANSDISQRSDPTPLARMGGDLKLLQRTANIFLRDLPGRMAAINTSIERKDARALAQSAHALKGSVSIFGAPIASQHAQSLEDLGKKNEFSRALPLLDALKEEIAKLEENLRGYARQTGGAPSRKPRKGLRRPDSGKQTS